MKILFLIRQLSTGGAERQVVLLARGLAERGHAVTVMVFYGSGALEPDLASTSIRLIDLGKRGRWDNAVFLVRLVRALRQVNPDVIYSFLTVANLLTGLLGFLLPRVKRVWGLRASNMDLSRYDWLSQFTGRLESRLAQSADLIIANSETGRDAAIASGFPLERLRVVRNGIETKRFQPNPEDRARIRAEWRIGPEHFLVGLVGRLDPMKGHPDFIQAAARLRATHPDVRWVCVGEGPSDYRQTLAALAMSAGLADTLLWVGNRLDMPAVYNALDLAVSASIYGEGVSNMLGEAMASGVPCVTTKVGDSAWVVGDTGIVVPPGQPAALAEGITAQLERLTSEGESLRRVARRRIEAHLSVDALLDNTLSALKNLL
jgi:glycosyltransferase involved in cell wall biosynthesis